MNPLGIIHQPACIYTSMHVCVWWGGVTGLQSGLGIISLYERMEKVYFHISQNGFIVYLLNAEPDTPLYWFNLRH